MDEHTHPVVAHAETAYQAIRAINHLSLRGAVPAPLLYEVLGNLKAVGHLLPQALTQLGRGLAASLGEYAVYDGAGKDPAASVAKARASLAEAAARAADLGLLLEAAQSAINEQGYHPADPSGPVPRQPAPDPPQHTARHPGRQRDPGRTGPETPW
jgi:hypothetical protein